MKTNILSLILFVACQAAFAQGISVQGIARNAEKAALVNQPMTFTFDIQDADANSYYKERQEITTDLFGVFSHIVGTGTKEAGGNFNEIPFGQEHMKLVITADGIVISNAPFQYAPYAKSAENGVPTGTIVAFAGGEANVPAGWVLCDGRALSAVTGSKNLIALIGANAPDLRGMFLRGVGVNSVYGQAGPSLLGTQDDAFETHDINGITNNTGSHNHPFRIDTGADGSGAANLTINDATVYAPAGGPSNVSAVTTSAGAHVHDVSGQSVGGSDETRPVNLGVNYIIKL